MNDPEMKYDMLGIKDIECVCPVCGNKTIMKPHRKIYMVKRLHSTCDGIDETGYHRHEVCYCKICDALFDVGKFDNLISRYNLKLDRKKN